MVERIISFLGKTLKEDGINGLIPIMTITILALIFISPSYILIFFYKRSLLIENNLIINIFTILILDTVLFFALFVVGSLRGIKKVNGKFENQGILLNDIVITIFLMGIISVALLLFCGLRIILIGDTNIKEGMWILIIILVIIFGYYIIIIYKKYKET
ncbi:putative membrane protein [Clostridium baratii str. Sullivan]|uniref:Putative membrane protein n=1 Tax=Clostridium baratii str. Sullivan TaxID=1415775 RepID=A0A0A7FSS5_9CLOT|nr:hypothetical protein [Clostridium baratii]AIY82657.1 putative membrane protein [Clostridium baratii str. Sullivan]